MEQKMTLSTFLVKQGLLLLGDKKVAQMQALTDDDKLWFAERAAVECNVTIIDFKGNPILAA